MTPPINIGGDTVDAITIDGTEVTEVTADGEVVFGSAIPDILDDRWPADEGSGQSLSNRLGSVGISLDFDQWTTGSQYSGDTAPDYPDNSNAVTNSQININDTQTFVGAWFDGVTSVDSFAGFFTTSQDGSIPANGFMLFRDNSDTAIGLRMQNSGNNNEAFRNVTVPDLTNNQLFIGLGIDGDNAELWVYQPNGTQEANATGTASRGVTASEYLSISTAFGGENFQGPIDDIVTARGSKPSTSKVEEIVAATGPNG